jgi:hypothetical protein
MKESFVLGVIGGISAILIGIAVGFFPVLAYIYLVFYPFGIFGYYLHPSIIFQIVAMISGVGGILGITGGIWGKKSGGALMIIGSILVLIGISVLGIIPSILMLVGGILTPRVESSKSDLPPSSWPLLGDYCG